MEEKTGEREKKINRCQSSLRGVRFICYLVRTDVFPSDTPRQHQMRGHSSHRVRNLGLRIEILTSHKMAMAFLFPLWVHLLWMPFHSWLPRIQVAFLGLPCTIHHILIWLLHSLIYYCLWHNLIQTAILMQCSVAQITEEIFKCSPPCFLLWRYSEQVISSACKLRCNYFKHVPCHYFILYM